MLNEASSFSGWLFLSRAAMDVASKIPVHPTEANEVSEGQKSAGDTRRRISANYLRKTLY
jgi:hypothetical protein